MLWLAMPALADELVLMVGTHGDGNPVSTDAELYRLGFTAEQVADAQPLADYAFGGATLWPRAVEISPCPADRVEVDLGAATQAGKRALDEWDYETTVTELEAVTERLACLAQPVDGPSLARAAVLLGYARFETDDLKGARQAFEAAATFDLAVGWDEEFPPDAKLVFDAAIHDAAADEPARIEIEAESKLAREVLVDGKPLPRNGEVRAGVHHLSLPAADGMQVRLALELAPGQQTQIVGLDTLIQEFVGGDASTSAAARALSNALVKVGQAEAVLVDFDGAKLQRFQAATHRLLGMPAPSGAKMVGTALVFSGPPLQQHRQRNVGIGLAGGGGVLALIGFIGHGVSYNQGLVETDAVHYQQLRNNNGAGFALGMTGVAVGVSGAVLLLVSQQSNAKVTMVPGPVPSVAVRF